jgi:predicted permease
VAGGIIKVFGGLAVALVVLRFFSLDPVLMNVMLIQSAMPTAVNVVVYATEFDCRPRLVTIGILASTLISIASITLILNYLIR